MMNARLTKKMVKAMTSEELQAKLNDLQQDLAITTDNKEQNILKGYIGMVEVEISTRGQNSIELGADGVPQETIVVEGDADGQADNKEEGVEQPAEQFVVPSTLAGAMSAVATVLAGEDSDNTKLAKIMKIAEHNVDYTELPYDLCTDAELMRRLKLLWSKRVAAKKAGDFATLEDIDKQEAIINSYKTVKATRTGTVSSENVDHSKLGQADLQKLIRNYQSKKSNAKKLYEAALADLKVAQEQGLDTELERLSNLAAEHRNLMEHWQAKVDDASKYRTSTPAGQKNAALVQQIKDTIAALEPLKDNPQVAEKIEQLKKLL